MDTIFLPLFPPKKTVLPDLKTDFQRKFQNLNIFTTAVMSKVTNSQQDEAFYIGRKKLLPYYMTRNLKLAVPFKAGVRPEYTVCRTILPVTGSLCNFRKVMKKSERKLVIIEGEDSFVSSTLEKLCNFVVDETNYKTISKSYGHLGEGFNSVGYSALQRVNPEVLSSLEGMVTSGGMLVIGTKKFEDLADAKLFHDDDSLRYKSDRRIQLSNNYLKRLVNKILEYGQFIRIDARSDMDDLLKIKERPNKDYDLGFLELTDRMKEFLSDDYLKVLLVTGCRGSGKSTRLAFMVRELAKKHYSITVTGMISHAAKKILDYNPHMHFTGIDSLATKELSARDVIVIDEVASVPLPKLKELVSTGARLLLAGTTDGYEGTGSGIMLKFLPYLDMRGLSYRLNHLETCFRHDDDALGKLWKDIFRPGYSDNRTAAEPPAAADSLQMKEISSEDLMKSEKLLADVYSLLSGSHYKTAPSDLRQLLDNPLNRLFILTDEKDEINGVLWGICEEMKDSMVPEVFLNRRRPRGNLIPQTLVAHCGFKNAGFYRFFRIIRIVVPDSLRRNSYGTTMLRYAEKQLSDRTDFFGVSFGVAEDLLKFWQSNGYIPVKLGMKEDAASGLFSVVMLKTLGRLKQDVLQEWRDAFIGEYLHSACWQHRELSPAVAVLLMKQGKSREKADGDYIRNLISLSEGQRNPEQALVHVTRWISENSDDWTKWPDENQKAFIGYFVQHTEPENRIAVEKAVDYMRGDMGKLIDDRDSGSKNAD
jgi:tRNA(Met) cytidine acetyltransferase